MEELDAARLSALRDLDVRTVDPDTLAEITEVRVDTGLPPEERLADAIRQMKGNPYFFRCGGIVVKTSFLGEAPLQQLLEDCLRTPDPF